MFKQKNIMSQKGFTLLELLVVITLLAILAVGGLVAYDGVADNAEASAAAFNAGTVDRAVRQYRAVTNAYPDQWDNLAAFNSAAPAGGPDFLAPETQAVFGSFDIGATTPAFQSAFYAVVADVWGMEEIQHVVSAFTGEVAPGKMHNEGSGGAIETNFAAGEFSHISILPTADDGVACNVGGQPASTTFSGETAGQAMSFRQNAINDALGIGRCHFVIALGFGGDAASSTSRASVQIPAAPTYTSNNINPAENYGRYIGLFHVARTGGSGDITEANIFPRPKLIGFVDTEGNPVDVNIAASRDPS
jgi:prepilin-type N-terminal cleavage/methylation domain-containing protein